VNNRDTIFISHANPEDNDFTRWLALQLARNGYRVWCDLTRLLGGEDFWSDIETTIRERTCKFLYVLSHTSNHRPGTLQELQVAVTVEKQEGFKDFIIPLRVDDLPTGEFNIQLARRNAIKFNQGWASGLQILLEKLDQDNIPRDTNFNPEMVATWWKTQFASECMLINQTEEYLSNVFPIINMPCSLFVHELKYNYHLLSKPSRFPYRRYEGSLISFASATDLEQDFKLSGCISHTIEIPYDDFVQNKNPIRVSANIARNVIIDLLRQSWENSIQDLGMLKYELSGRSVAAYFKNGFFKRNLVNVSGITEEEYHRGIVGYETRKDWEGNILGKRYWHFAIQFKPTFSPSLAFIAISHVLFSYDGEHILDNKGLLHRLRRSKCRDWWNPEWRDKILGTVQWLSREENNIQFKVGSSSVVQVSPKPLVYISDMSFTEPKSKLVVLSDEEDEDGITEEAQS